MHSRRFDTSYHSTHGAIQESQHVFIDSGLQYWLSLHPHKRVIRIFEMGFGTGLNALMCWQIAQHLKILIEYTSVEKYPLEEGIYKQLNYADGLDVPANILQELHEIEWGVFHSLGDYFQIKKINNSIENMGDNGLVDLVFYDAFGPRTQPELWDFPVMSIVEHMMAEHGVLVTYCAQGAFRRTLKSLGLEVSKIPGPPGKREMTRAVKVTKD